MWEPARRMRRCRARIGIGDLQQEPSIFRRLTVRENSLASLETLPLKPKERAERLAAG